MRLGSVLILLALMLLVALAAGGCITVEEVQPQPAPTAPAPAPWSGKIYAGSPARAGIERAQAGELIRCTDPVFDGFICLTAADLEALIARQAACLQVPAL